MDSVTSPNRIQPRRPWVLPLPGPSFYFPVHFPQDSTPHRSAPGALAGLGRILRSFSLRGLAIRLKRSKKSVFSRLSLSDDQAMKKPDPGAILLSQDAFAGACLQANGY